MEAFTGKIAGGINVNKVTELISEVKIDLRPSAASEAVFRFVKRITVLKSNQNFRNLFSSVAQWLRCWTMDQKVPGSIPDFGKPVLSLLSFLKCFIISKDNSILGFITIVARWALGTFPSCSAHVSKKNLKSETI